MPRIGAIFERKHLVPRTRESFFKGLATRSKSGHRKRTDVRLLDIVDAVERSWKKRKRQKGGGGERGRKSVVGLIRGSSFDDGETATAAGRRTFEITRRIAGGKAPLNNESAVYLTRLSFSLSRIRDVAITHRVFITPRDAPRGYGQASQHSKFWLIRSLSEKSARNS